MNNGRLFHVAVTLGGNLQHRQISQEVRRRRLDRQESRIRFV
jgi:hypothetical protein